MPTRPEFPFSDSPNPSDLSNPAARMRRALAEARKAFDLDEVPVGAIVTGPDGAELAAAHDERISLKDPTAHAEILALRRAAQVLGDWRLEDCDLTVTLEPCSMCAGALVLARIRHLTFGAQSPKSGAVITHARLLDIETFNHSVSYTGGILAEKCAALLSDYFRKKR